MTENSSTVHVVEFFGRGGLIHYAYQLCRALSDQSLDVKLITAQDYELSDYPHNFPIEKLFHLWDPKPMDAIEPKSSSRKWWNRSFRKIWRGLLYYHAWWQLIRYLRKNRPDVVQFGEIMLLTDLIPLMILRLSRLRLADICHNIAPFDTNADSNFLVKTSWKYRLIYRGIYKCFFAIFVHGDYNRREFLRLYGGNLNRVYMIHHGVGQIFKNIKASEPQNRTLRSKLKIPDDSKVVLFFGALTKYKGVDYLLDAFAIVKRQFPTAHLIIAGFPNQDVNVDALFSRTYELNIRESVVFYLQYVPNEEVAPFFNVADVVVFPYIAIYQSGALHLALSFCKPVVATDVGAIPEVVKHGENGLLVPSRDSQALAKAILNLLSDSNFARRIATQSRELSKNAHSWNIIANKIKEIYFPYS